MEFGDTAVDWGRGKGNSMFYPPTQKATGL
jgi:hypothetical protein